jgi:hypothetical protein
MSNRRRGEGGASMPPARPAQGGPPAANVCGTFTPNCSSNQLFSDSVVRCSSSDSMGGYVYGSFDMNSVMLYSSGFPAQDCCAGHESSCGMVSNNGTMIAPPGTVSPGDASQLLEMYREQQGWGRFRPIVIADLSSTSPLDTRLKGTVLLSGSPAITRNGTSDVFAFATGSDSRMYVKRATNETTWSTGNWADLGGSLASDPAAVSTTATQVGVVTVGTDGDLWQNWSNSNVWGGWGSLGRPGAAAISAPAIASMASNRVDVFVRSGTNLYQKTLINGIWGGWTDRGCCIQRPFRVLPAAVDG